MRVILDTSHVKQSRRNLYYTRVSINFSEEERAIIQTRALFDHHLTFDKGYVNYPPNAGALLDPAILRLGSRLLFIAGIPLLFLPPSGFISWLGSAGLFAYRKQQERTEAKALRNYITLVEIMGAPYFTVCSFENPINSRMLEQEIRSQLENIKVLITFSGQPIQPVAFEI